MNIQRENEMTICNGSCNQCNWVSAGTLDFVERVAQEHLRNCPTHEVEVHSDSSFSLVSEVPEITFGAFKTNQIPLGSAMIRYGGGFVTGLGAAIQNADMTNLRKIWETWPELISQYWSMMD